MTPHMHRTRAEAGRRKTSRMERVRAACQSGVFTQGSPSHTLYLNGRRHASTAGRAAFRPRRRRLIRSVVVVLLLAFGPLAAADASAEKKSWNFPADWNLWIGKYPSDREDGVNFWQIPAIEEQLHLLLDSRARADLDELVVEVPIEQHGEWIVARGCMPHDCMSSAYAIAVRGDARAMLVCIRSEADTGHFYLRWFATGRPPKVEPLPSDEGQNCSVEGVDPVPALLAEAAVDDQGKPITPSGDSKTAVVSPLPRTPLIPLAKCDDPDLKPQILAALTTVAKNGQVGVMADLASRFPLSNIRFEVMDIGQLNEVDEPPINMSDQKRTPSGTNQQSGPFMWDGAKVNGPIDPTLFTLCSGVMIVRFKHRNYTETHDTVERSVGEFRFILQPVEHSEAYNITIFGYAQAINAAMMQSIMRDLFGGQKQ